MSKITITPVDATHFIVDVESQTSSTHMVTVPAHYAQKLGAGSADSVQKLLDYSFQFLLEREPNTSILRSFELPVIERYFPEYTQEITKKLKG